jgi:hypothetical protein
MRLLAKRRYRQWYPLICGIIIITYGLLNFYSDDFIRHLVILSRILTIGILTINLLNLKHMKSWVKISILLLALAFILIWILQFQITYSYFSLFASSFPLIALLSITSFFGILKVE